MNTLNLRIFTVLFVAFVSTLLVIPNFISPEGKWWLPNTTLKYGLDIKGGLHLVMGVDTPAVLKESHQRTAQSMQEFLKGKNVIVQSIELEGEDGLKVVLTKPEDAAAVEENLKKNYSNILVVSTSGNEMHLRFDDSYEQDTRKNIVQHSIETLRNRIDEFGVTEPSITAQGTDRILIQLPGLEDATRAKELINKTARLDFMMVHDKAVGEDLNTWITDAEKAGNYSVDKMKYSEYVKKLNADLKAKLPANTKLIFAKNEAARDIQTGKVPYLVETNTNLGGDSLRDAFVTMDEYGSPEISMNFKPDGARKFDELTGANSGRMMAIVLDDVVYSAPNIKERISTGSARITLGGGRDYNTMLEEAKLVSMALRAGALPAKLEQLEERTVGPSLGSDSIASGTKATAIGAVLVLLFMLFYYKVFGIFANIALILNITMIYAGLTMLEATLTLPGIAGIALTIGMAVDANIVINERIKEELRKGLNFSAAFREGYEKAFVAVFDSHVTTALTCIILIYYGTGPVRGFGVTLLIGIVASLFTAIFVTRTIVDYLLIKRKLTSIPI